MENKVKKIQVIAFKRIIDPNMNKAYTDEQLRMFNAYYESTPITVDDNYDANTVVLEFEENNPEYAAGWLHKIVEL